MTHRLLLPSLAVLLASASSLAAERLYIANDDHTDYVWQGTEEDSRIAFLNMTSYYLNQAETTASNPSNTRGRFNFDGSFWAWTWQQNKPQSEMDRLMDQVRNKAITLPLNSLAILPGAMPTEAVLRDMYYAGRLERRYNFRSQLVVPQENQTLPGGVSSLWAGAGAKYAWKGICGCASQVNAGNRLHDIYWSQGPDGQSVLMKWSTLYGQNQAMGGYSEAFNPTSAVNFMKNDTAYRARWPWGVRAAFGHGWDALQTTTDAFITTAQTQSDANSTVIVSNELDFFEDFESNYGQLIPTAGASYGTDWELNTASLGEVTAGMRREVERLRGAEALAALCAPYQPSLLAGRDAARDDAFVSMGIFYEHDWTSDGPASSYREAFERDRLQRVLAYTQDLEADAIASLGALVSNPGGERYAVFNPLSWTRTDVATLPTTPSGSFHVVDVSTGTEVPSQLAPGGGVKIFASNLPSVGYRVYEVVAGSGTAFSNAATVSGSTVDNGLYAVTLGTDGSLTSVIDHSASNRQLVQSGGALNRKSTPTVAISGGGVVTVEAIGPVFVTLKVTAPGAPSHDTRVTLYRNMDRIELDNRIAQNFSDIIGFDFRYALSNFTTRHEEVGMVAKAARQSAGGDYADQNTGTNYLSLNHFVDLSEAGYGITLSSQDSAFMKLGNSTLTTLDTTTPRVFAVVGGQLNPGLGIASQGGDTAFLNRYALRSHAAYDPASAMRFALEHQNPALVARLTGPTTGPLPATNHSALSVSSPDVLAWAVKPAEEGIGLGTIIRLWNLAETPRSVTVSLTSGITSARQVTHIETDIGPATLSSGALTDTLARQQLKTYRLHTNLPAVSDAAVTSSSPPSGSWFAAGASFTQTWTLQNVGNTTWSSADGFALVHESGSQFGAPATLSLNAGETVPPGSSRTWTVPMTAPTQTGASSGTWRMKVGSTFFGQPAQVNLQVAQTGSAPGLVAAWGFNEGSGATAVDATGLGHTGTLNGATWTNFGRFGAALTFDGTNDFVTVADANDLDFTNGMTLSAWVFPTVHGSDWRTVVMKEQPGQLVYALYSNDGANHPSGHVYVGGDTDVHGTTAPPTNTWSHLAVTYDGSTLRLYVDATQVASRAVSGNVTVSSGQLRIGGNSIWGEYFAGRIDEVRVYDRALTVAELQSDMNSAVGVGGTSDTQAPTVTVTAPSSGATVSGAVALSANASDNVGVAGVQFKVDGTNVGAEVTSAPYSLSWSSTAASNGSHQITAVARDAAGNSTTSAAVNVTVSNTDLQAPTVSVTGPAGGATVSGVVTLSANASDNVGVVGVQFKVDGTNVGAEVTSAPYSLSWSSTAVSNGSHQITAVARDAAGNTTTSSAVAVTVDNQVATGLVAAWSFNAGTGTTAADATGLGHTGTLNGPTWSTQGKYGGALSFDGTNDLVSVADANDLDLTSGMTLEAWVLPTAHGTSWRTVAMKEQSGQLIYALYSNDGTGKPSGHVYIGGDTDTHSPTGLTLNTWSHVAATYDGATLRLYVNGTQVSSRAVTGNIAVSTGQVRIGGNTVWGEYFAGSIDEVRIYNRALTATEIATDMNAPLP